MDSVIIRPLEKKDNEAIAKVIRNVLIEHNVPKVGTAYADASLDCMFETYSTKGSAYFVIEKDGEIIGGAGIAPWKMVLKILVNYKKCIFCNRPGDWGLAVK